MKLKHKNDKIIEFSKQLDWHFIAVSKQYVGQLFIQQFHRYKQVAL